MTLLAAAGPALLRAIRSELGPNFINRQQRAFFDSRAPEVLYSGAFRAGKSRIGCEKAYWLAQRYPGIPIGIFRKYASTLAASTERTLIHEVIPPGAIVKSNRTEHWYELANGSRIWLFGLDPDPVTGLPTKVGSVELGWAFVDEAVECVESDWVQVKGRLSWPGIPFHQIAAATNPASPTHWLKRRFTPPTPERVYLHASTLDNPALPADYVAEQAALPDGVFRRRYVEGQWVAAQGAIWTLPDDQIAVSPGPFKRVVAGIDWGFQHAFACEVVGQSGTGRISVITEIYERGRTLDEIIPALRGVRDRHNVQMFYADPSEPAYIEQCRRAGLPVAPATNDVLPGITAVSEAIAAGMLVDPSCTGLIGEIPAYVWAPERATGSTEKPVKVGDDAADALRYACMGLRSGASVTQSSYIPSLRPPVVVRGDLRLVGAKYLDKVVTNGHR